MSLLFVQIKRQQHCFMVALGVCDNRHKYKHRHHLHKWFSFTRHIEHRLQLSTTLQYDYGYGNDIELNRFDLISLSLSFAYSQFISSPASIIYTQFWFPFECQTFKMFKLERYLQNDENLNVSFNLIKENVPNNNTELKSIYRHASILFLILCVFSSSTSCAFVFVRNMITIYLINKISS